MLEPFDETNGSNTGLASADASVGGSGFINCASYCENYTDKTKSKCEYYNKSTSDNTCDIENALDESCNTYTDGGGPTGNTMTTSASNYNFRVMKYPVAALTPFDMDDSTPPVLKFPNCVWGATSNCPVFYQDNYGNFTWQNVTDSAPYTYKINMISDPCSAVSLSGVTLENMNVTTGEIIPQVQMFPELAVNVTCSNLDEGDLCCGNRIYTIKDTEDKYGDFFKYSDSTGENVLTLRSESYDDVGSYDVEIEVTLEEWPNAVPATLTLTVEVEDCVPELE
jgi:hypothetical protein